jgi:hypothetical protein
MPDTPAGRNRGAAWRDALAALRETSIAPLIIGFIIFPKALGSRLQALGVGNIEFAGVKTDVASVVKSKAATQSLASQLKRDSVARDTVLAYLREIEKAAPTPLRAKLQQATLGLDAPQRNAAAVDSSLRRSIAVQDSVLAKVSSFPGGSRRLDLRGTSE